MALPCAAQDDPVTREDAKKSLTHGMLESTTWASEEQQESLIVGLLGTDEALRQVLGEYLPTIEVRGHAVRLVAYESATAASEANILLLARSE